MGPKVIKYVVLAVIVVNLVIIAIVFSGGNTPPAKPLPNPNGYDDFVKAGKIAMQLVPANNTNVDYASMNMEQLAAHKAELTALTASNTEPLKLIDVGLSRECRQPMIYSRDWAATFNPEFMFFRRLCYLLCVEGRLAEAEGHPDNAARIYLTNIRFGQESSRGGMIPSKLVGLAIENTASPLLFKLTRNLDATNCHEIAGALEAIDAREEPVSDVFEQQRLWRKKSLSLEDKTIMLLDEIRFKSQKEVQRKVIAKIQSTQSTRRRMMMGFAARAYELEKGKPPQNVSDLVPDYLKAVPKDPVTGKDMGLGN